MSEITKTLGLILAAIVLIAGVIWIATSGEKAQTEEPEIGFSGPDIPSYVNVRGTFTQGGGIYATSSAGNRTMESAGWDTEMVFSDTPTVGAMTLTTMASSSGPFDKFRVGQTRYLCVENATTTSGINLTVAAGSGVNVNVASSSTLVLGATARLCGHATKAADTDIEWDVTKYGE